MVLQFVLFRPLFDAVFVQVDGQWGKTSHQGDERQHDQMDVMEHLCSDADSLFASFSAAARAFSKVGLVSSEALEFFGVRPRVLIVGDPLLSEPTKKEFG